MCQHNDAYAENIKQLIKFVREQNFPASSSVLDVGAGTGNFVCELAQEFPKLQITHLDSNREMNEIALSKYETLNLQNVRVIEEPVQRAEFAAGSFDLVICVNALYAMNPQELILAKLRGWIDPSGFLYVIDLGRRMDSWDWGRHFFKEAYKQKRLLSYLTDAVSRGREVLRQNNMTRIAQETGQYWIHETDEFREALISAGFKIQEIEPCYRGYADRAVCKPAGSNL